MIAPFFFTHGARQFDLSVIVYITLIIFVTTTLRTWLQTLDVACVVRAQPVAAAEAGYGGVTRDIRKDVNE